MTQPQPKKSDLPTRVASAVVMVVVAGTALCLGGWVFKGFAIAVGVGVLWEWWGLVRRFASSVAGRAAWLLGGVIYIGQAVIALIALRQSGIEVALTIVTVVIATDIGAYCAGRTFGGPKIAPAISPSKTWSGLIGGIVAASLVVFLATGLGCYDGPPGFLEKWYSCLKLGFFHLDTLIVFPIGAAVAIVAQAGDFFESWLKRRAGVKDSGNLIPGHGGLFDRVDGLLAVLCLTAIAYRAF